MAYSLFEPPIWNNMNRTSNCIILFVKHLAFVGFFENIFETPPQGIYPLYQIQAFHSSQGDLFQTFPKDTDELNF